MTIPEPRGAEPAAPATDRLGTALTPAETELLRIYEDLKRFVGGRTCRRARCATRRRRWRRCTCGERPGPGVRAPLRPGRLTVGGTYGGRTATGTPRARRGARAVRSDARPGSGRFAVPPLRRNSPRR